MAKKNTGQIIRLNRLTYTKGTPDSSIIPFSPCEVKSLKYKKGDIIPLHKHSDDTLKIIIEGRIETPGGDLMPGMLYKCGSFEYGPWIIAEDTTIVVIQNHGTNIIKAKK